jgi:hypothetical protein
MLLSEARKGQIAYAAMKDRVREEGIHGLKQNSFRREIGNMAKTLGFPESEMVEFVRTITAEVLSEAFDAVVTIR